MKKRILYTFIVMFVACVANTKALAQSFGVEQNANGSYTFTFADGGTITTNINGSYSSTNGTGSCSGCAQVLPAVVVYGYPKSTTTTTPEYVYTSYSYNNQYYNLPSYGGAPAPYTSGGSVTTQPVITTAPAPVPPPPPPPNDPCKANTITTPTTPTPAHLTAPAYTQAVNSLTATMSYSALEHSMFLGISTAQGSQGTFTTTPIKPGDFSGSNGNPSAPYFIPFASAHTHPNTLIGSYPMPSVGDIYSLATWNAQYPSYTTAYVISQADGSTTALVVTDHQKLMNFLAAYPSGTCQVGADWSPDSDMAKACAAVVTSLDPVNQIPSTANDEAWRAAQAYVLDKFDTGMIMVKKNNDGTFSQIHFVQTTDAQGNVSYKQYNCN